MKAILVIDLPKKCDTCPFGEEDCVAMREPVEEGVWKTKDIVDGRARPLWCPLRPMPKRYAEDDFVVETPRDVEACTHGIRVGRNVVINEILGETE